MIIASQQNPRYKYWKKLKSKKGRKLEQAFLVEGEHLVIEALKAKWPIVEIIQSELYQPPNNTEWSLTEQGISAKKVVISSALFRDLSETESPQGIAAVIKIPNQVTVKEVIAKSRFLLLIDQVQDPGNLGTIIRTADAAGLDAVVLGKGTVDPFSGKVLRSTQGSIFHIPLLETGLADLMTSLLNSNWKVWGTSLEQSKDYRNIQISKGDKVALIIGNEGNGVEPGLLESTSQNIKIPIWGKADSLNVAIATGILLYHIQGQLTKGEE